MSKVKYMNCIFKDCSSLISLPDISKWDTSKVKKIYDMFEGCFGLLVIPREFKK